jgi:hypothetical protein
LETPPGPQSSVSQSADASSTNDAPTEAPAPVAPPVDARPVRQPSMAQVMENDEFACLHERRRHAGA